MIRSIIAAVAVSALSVPAVAQQAQSDILPLEGVAALVNDKPISYFDVRQRTQMLLVTFGAQPTQEIYQQLLGTALDQLIDEQLQLQAAEEFELEISRDRIDDSLNRLAQSSGTNVDGLKAEFARSGISMSTLENQIRADIGWQDIMRGRFGRNIRISKARVDQQMDVFVAESESTAYQLSEIFLFAPDEETKIQARAVADNIIEQLKAGAPFQSVAQQISRAPTAAAGGDMGWVALDDLDPAIAKVVAAAEVTGILEPIIVEDGVYIMVLRGKREPQESVNQLSLMQIVAADNKIDTLETAMDRIDNCDDLKTVADSSDNLMMADLGTVDLKELASDSQALVKDLEGGELSQPFESTRGWSSLAVCSRKDGALNLPSDGQVENQLYGRELNMISNRELRNARLEATIIQEFGRSQ